MYCVIGPCPVFSDGDCRQDYKKDDGVDHRRDDGGGSETEKDSRDPTLL